MRPGVLVALALLATCSDGSGPLSSSPPTVAPPNEVDGEAATALRRRTDGRDSEGAYELLQALLSVEVGAAAAVDVVVALVATFDTPEPTEQNTALMLAAIEEASTAPHDSASRVITQIGVGLGLDETELQDLPVAIFGEVLKRSRR